MVDSVKSSAKEKLICDFEVGCFCVVLKTKSGLERFIQVFGREVS